MAKDKLLHSFKFTSFLLIIIQMMHCNISPTSPPETVTEFPPQRSEVVHGHGNFVVGGYGSGESARPAVKTNSFRGGMVWPDKGSVCASRASMQSDAFANSLRKYPNITQERTSEIVERLISFTQAKNLSKHHNRCPHSPTRNSIDSEWSKQTFILERNHSKNSIIGKTIYHPEVNGANRSNRIKDNSSERERSNNFLVDENNDSWNRPVFCKSNDVRCFRETTRIVNNEFKKLFAPPTSQFKRISPPRTRDQHESEVYQRRVYDQENNRPVNMEIQAAAQMESKEILTLPRIMPMQRTIATSLSPIASRIEEGIRSTHSSCTDLLHESSCKSIQVKLPLDADIKKTSSSFDLRKTKFINKSNNRSRSEEKLRNVNKTTAGSISNFMEFNNTSNVNELFNKTKRRKSKPKKICQNCKLLFNDFDILRQSISNNTYFGDDFQCRINQQHQSTRVSNNRIQQLEFPSHTSNDIISKPDVAQNKSSFTKVTNDTYGNQFDSDRVNIMNPVVKERSREKCIGRLSRNDEVNNEGFRDKNSNNKNSAITLEEIRNLIDLDILAFADKYRINITTENLNDLIEELFDLFVRGLNNTSYVHKKNISEEVQCVLQSKGLSEFQSIYLTNILTEHWEDDFLTINNLKLNSSKFKSKTLIVFPNITQESSQYKRSESNTNDGPDYSINEISQKDIDFNVKVYVSQMSNEINDWLLNLQIHEVQDNNIRQAIVNELVNDIVDRHKYLELNPCNEISEKSELEHLKYQIFKVLYKHDVGDMKLVNHATDLMKRIQIITVPIFSIKERQDRKLGAEENSKLKIQPIQSLQSLKAVESSNSEESCSRYKNLEKKCCNKPMCKRNHSKTDIPDTSRDRNSSLKEPGTSYQAGTSTKIMRSPSKIISTETEYDVVRETPHPETKEPNRPFKQNQSSTTHVPYNSGSFFSGGIKIKDDENDNNTNYCNAQIIPSNMSESNKSYNQYLKEWVAKLPLPITSAEDQMLAEVTRTDIYNGILEAVSKVKCERDTLNNRFLFEDKLDTEIEKILNKLPQTPELVSQKHIFKIKLIEKTNNNTDFTQSSAKSYKQKLVESIKDYIPQTAPNESENPDILKVYEELQILNIVEDFIMYSRYQNQEPVIAEAYRKKLIKRTEDFVEELKANHNKALKDINSKLYLKDILDTLKNVTLPTSETIQEEADEILVSIEIDKWFSDLPLTQNNDYIEQLHRQRLKNNLVKQIVDIEKGTVSTASILDNSLKHEISQFLEKVPLQHGESLNINVMVDELINRLKSRKISVGNDNKKVVFNEPDYEEFRKNMPLCSTYTESFDKNVNSENKTIQSIDTSQQLHNGRCYISKPLFDDLKVNKNCRNTDRSAHKIPSYETFGKTHLRSSTLKDDLEPHWYTLHESRPEYQQTNSSLKNIRNNTAQNNKSIQAISPSAQSHNRHYHNIAQPLLDDLRLDSHCFNNDITDDQLLHGVPPRTSVINGRSEPNWYTLQESKQEYSQSNILKPTNETSNFVPYPLNTSQRISDYGRFNEEQYNVPEHEFIVPQHYSDKVDKNNYIIQQRHNTSFQSLRNSPKRANDKDSTQGESQNEQRWTNSHSTAGANQTRRESLNINEKNTRLDQVISPHRPSYSTSLKEPKTHTSNRTTGFQNIIEEQHIENSKLQQSDLFYKSTDQDGIRQTIARNKSMDANLETFDPPKHRSGYYQPSVIIPPGYIPLRIDTKKGGYMADRNIDEGLREEESEEDNDEEGEIRCRCVEKFWKGKRRYRFCPFEQYDGFPMCLSSPYIYPYFY